MIVRNEQSQRAGDEQLELISFLVPQHGDAPTNGESPKVHRIIGPAVFQQPRQVALARGAGKAFLDRPG